MSVELQPATLAERVVMHCVPQADERYGRKVIGQNPDPNVSRSASSPETWRDRIDDTTPPVHASRMTNTSIEVWLPKNVKRGLKTWGILQERYYL